MENMIVGAISIRFAVRLGQVQPPHIIYPWVVTVGDPAQGTDGGYVFLPCSPMVSRREAVPCSSLHLKLFHSLVPNSDKSTDIQCFFLSAWLKKKTAQGCGVWSHPQHGRYQHGGRVPLLLCHNGAAYLRTRSQPELRFSLYTRKEEGQWNKDSYRTGSVHPWKWWWLSSAINTYDLYRVPRQCAIV